MLRMLCAEVQHGGMAEDLILRDEKLRLIEEYTYNHTVGLIIPTVRTPYNQNVGSLVILGHITEERGCIPGMCRDGVCRDLRRLDYKDGRSGS